MWVVVFSAKFYKELSQFLFSTTNENGCFLLAKSYKTKHNSILLVTDVIKPKKDSWNNSGEHSLEPSSSFINQCVVSADNTNSSLIFVHTHPNIKHPSTFSWIDEKSNDEIFANLSQILIDVPLGSLVFSRKGICGVVFEKNSLQNVSKIKIVGNTLNEFFGIGFSEKQSSIETKFNRQVKALGKKQQKQLQDTIVTVVGVGGTGSPVAIQLAKMGVHKLQLIDVKKLDHTNLPRVYGSKDSDIGKPKTEVLKEHIETFSKCIVKSICMDVTDKNIIENLIESDVIFACTDNLTSRSVLNDISIKYYIPLIDVGCRIDLNSNGTISQAIVKVQVVTPDSACLWCTGTLDGKIILQESFSEEEKEKLANEGYYDNVEKQPSVISLTTIAASMAVTKFLNILGVMGDTYNSRTQIELKDEFMIVDNPEIKVNCVCQKNRSMIEIPKF